MQPLLNIAFRAARSAARVIIRNMDRLDVINVEEKAHNDFVTEIDKKAEAEIINVIRKSYPEHAIMAEESGLQRAVAENKSSHQGEYLWIIDPIDGTFNFMHGNPHFCISIAIQYKNKIQHGLIYDPLRDELFTASLGDGALLNNKRIRTKTLGKLDTAAIGMTFSNRGANKIEDYLQLVNLIFPHVAVVRCSGSAALDLAYVAAGRTDGLTEINLRPWDIAAGTLIIQESGGIVSDFAGKDNFLEEGKVVAGNPKIHKALMKLLLKK